jgi:hypothetical protein
VLKKTAERKNLFCLLAFVLLTKLLNLATSNFDDGNFYVHDKQIENKFGERASEQRTFIPTPWLDLNVVRLFQRAPKPTTPASFLSFVSKSVIILLIDTKAKGLVRLRRKINKLSHFHPPPADAFTAVRPLSWPRNYLPPGLTLISPLSVTM